MEKIKVNIDWADNYGASSDNDFAVGCLATADTLDEIKEVYTDLLKFHFKGMADDGDKVPETYSLVFVLHTRALLQQYKNVISRAYLSKRSGINEKLIGHYATGHKKPRQANRDKLFKTVRELGKELYDIA